MDSIALVGSVPEPILHALRAAGHDVVEGNKAEVVVAYVRGDWPAFSPGSVVIALCDSLAEAGAAYRAGAQVVAPVDPEVVVFLVRRAHEQRSVRSLADLEREAILSALKASAGNTARAAALLDISVRKVQYKLHEYGVPLSRKSPRPKSS